MNVVLPYDAVRPAREADGVRQKFYRGTTGITKPRSLTLKSHSDLRRPFLTPSLMVSYCITPLTSTTEAVTVARLLFAGSLRVL